MTNGRLLMIVGASKNRGRRENALGKVLSVFFRRTVYVTEKTLYRELSELSSETKKVYLVSENVFPCSDSFGGIFDYMEKNTDAAALWNMKEFCGSDKSGSLREDFPFFMCIDISSPDPEKIMRMIFKINSFGELSAALSDYLTGESWFSVWVKRELGHEAAVPFVYNAGEYLKSGFPFLSYTFFKLDRMDFIKYGTDDVPSEVFKRLISDCGKAEDLLEYFAEECGASHLKDLLGLNLAVKADRAVMPPVCGKYAVFVHLHYERFFDHYIEYLNSAANFCDVFISVDTEEKRSRLMSIADDELKSRLTVVLCENRGRDLSALLVAFKPYTARYEYFCFLHDKSSHEDEAETVGRAFSDCMWDNLLGNGSIPEVLSFFEENPYIGLLVPPIPYWGVYLELKSDFWTVCYDKTLELSKRLGITAKIDKEVNPAALGTAFWCRTKALLPLLEYPWRYEDFDEEPLKIDGTISHALERILPYAALDRRFLTSWIMSENYMPRILESHLLLAERQMRALKQSPIRSAAGKTSEQIGVRGALCVFKEAAVLLFKSFGKFFIKRLSK